MSAWIEIDIPCPGANTLEVALCMSAWIEIDKNRNAIRDIAVALCMSAWIEIAVIDILISMEQRRTLHECVD